MKRRRRNKHRNGKKNVLLIFSFIFGMLLLFSYGYSAFSTQIKVDVSGNTKKWFVSEAIRKFASKDSLTMMTDPFGNIRYTGSDEAVHNYVCLVDENPCQDKNLFRIIGSFIDIDDGNENKETRVKIVKSTVIGAGDFDTTGSSNWARPADLNTALNTTYYDSLDRDAQDLIGNAVWNLGGASNPEFNALDFYNFERSNNVYCNNSICNETLWNGKIALMYPSDYGYASSECIGLLLSSYRNSNCISSNWLKNTGFSEHLLTHNINYPNCIFHIHSEGYVGHLDHLSLLRYRPAAFLKPNTILITKNHDGTKLNPYIVKLDE